MRQPGVRSSVMQFAAAAALNAKRPAVAAIATVLLWCCAAAPAQDQRGDTSAPAQQTSPEQAPPESDVYCAGAAALADLKLLEQARGVYLQLLLLDRQLPCARRGLAETDRGRAKALALFREGQRLSSSEDEKTSAKAAAKFKAALAINAELSAASTALEPEEKKSRPDKLGEKADQGFADLGDYASYAALWLVYLALLAVPLAVLARG